MLLVLNKIDLVKDKSRLLPLIEQYRKLLRLRRLRPGFGRARATASTICARRFSTRLPEGPAYFPEDHVTDQPERFLAAELIREKVLGGDPRGSAAFGRRHRRPLGGDCQADPHLRHHPCGARRPEGHSDRRQSRHPQTDRNRRPPGNGTAVRRPHLSGSARPRPARMARASRLPRTPWTGAIRVVARPSEPLRWRLPPT